MMKGKKRAKMGPWPRLQKFWDVRAACNFIGGGTGSGLLFLAAIFILLEKPTLSPIIAGCAFICFGLFMVFLEIGKPWRSINMFFHPQTSWMTREGIVVMPLFLCAGLLFLNREQMYQPVIASFMAAIALVFLYCQVRIINAARGIPAWCHPALKPYIFITGLTEATGIALCLPGLTEQKALWLALAVLLVLRFILWKNYSSMLHRDKVPEASRDVIDGIYLKVIFAHLLAIVLIGSAWFSGGMMLLIPAGLVAAFTGWYTKVVIITRAARTRGFSIPRTPVRGQGKSRILSQ